MNIKSLIVAVVGLIGIERFSFAETKADQDILIAVRAHAGVQQAYNKWQPTIDYLNQTLPQYRFQMRPYTSLKQQLTDAGQQKYHFVLTNPATYVELEIKNRAKALLTLVNNRKGTAQTRFGSVIFTHVDHTDIIHLKDLKGKQFIGANPLGFGGWRVALKELLEHGIDPYEDFTNLSFAGNQPGVVKAVRDKKVHAGVVRTDMLERLADKGEINLRSFRILNQQETPGFPFFHSTPLYPEWPFAVMPHTKQQLVQQVTQALLGINETDPAARSGQYMGWTLALSYKPVKRLLQSLPLHPVEQKGSRTKNNSWNIAEIVLFISLILFLYIYSRKYIYRRKQA